MSQERILFVTGRLAEFSLRRVLEPLSRQADFEYEVAVLGISVAALMHPDWVLRKLKFDGAFNRVILPGWCEGDLQPLIEQFGARFERGPKDLYDLPRLFGARRDSSPELSRYNIEILAEINHAPRLSGSEILQIAESFCDSGADVIDIGCVPGETWPRAGEITRMLCDEGFRVSIDSFNRHEVEDAVDAGAELILSVNSDNLDWAATLPAEVVVIPDDPHDLSTLDNAVACLTERGSLFRIDPVLEPIGFGFAGSLARYFDVRRKWPDAPMMMGIGNLTELTEVDSAGINVLLAGICEELRIGSVLTTEVINWSRSAVREFDLARRLVCHSVEQHVLPKHFDSSLVMLRDAKLRGMGDEELAELATRITDPNFRIFAERGQIHIMNRDGYWRGTDPFELFDRVIAETSPPDAVHAFYLGYELAKAVTALTLGKQYTQDQALQWGFLTLPEQSAIEHRKARAKGDGSNE